MWSPLLPAPLLKALQDEPSLEGNLWLVGGAVRDSFLDRRTGDFDFAVGGDGLSLARSIADALGGDYYPLDDERGTGRVVAGEGEERWRTLDFASLRGASIDIDLRARDFTVNSMAREAFKDGLLDPTGGLQDVKDRRLRMSSPDALARDPLRALRALRLSSELGFRIDPELKIAITTVRSRLTDVSVERRRDELFRILAQPQPTKPLRAAHQLGVLSALLPGLATDQAEAGLATLDRLVRMLAVLLEQHDPDEAGDLMVAQLSFRLGRYRSALVDELGKTLAADRSRLQLLKLTAMAVADCQKGPSATMIGPAAIGEQLRLSRSEVAHLDRIERFFWDREASALQSEPSHRGIYRHFRRLGEAGVDVVLLKLACFLAEEAGPPEARAWAERVEAARGYLEPRLQGPAEWLDPPSLLRGDELIAELGLEKGPVVGRLLERIREAQAAGEVIDRSSALALARQQLSDNALTEGSEDQG